MTLQQLEYVVSLDNHKQFVRAAEQCYVSQPNLTTQIKKLEDEIGIRIFDRNSKPVKPTQAGEQFIIKARQIIREVNDLKEFVSTKKESIKGEFKLGVIPTIAPYLLPKFLSNFVEEYPETHLVIKELTTEQIIHELNRGTLDMGFMATPLNVNSIREIPLFYEPFLLYLPNNHPYAKIKELTADKIKNRGLLLLTEGHCFREQALQLCSSHKTENNRKFEFESGSIETIKGLVQENMGYALVPELSVDSITDKNYVKHFADPQPVREISIVVNNNFPKEALIECLRDSVQNIIPEHLKKGEKYTRVKWR